MNILHNHNSKETAYEIKSYPWGYKLRTSKFCWIETEPKKGDRFCSYTIDPRSGKECAIKKGVYHVIAFMYLDDVNHVQNDGVSIYDSREEVQAFVDRFGGVDILNKEQRKQFNSMMGINEVATDEFTGKVKKDFSVKWEKDWRDKTKMLEVKITFDRPDGVSLKEMFEAMKTLNQGKLNEVFEVRSYGSLGEYAGTVRICVRGGVQLGTIAEEDYKNYLASDSNVMQEEKA